MNNPTKYKPFLPWINLSATEIPPYRPDDRSGALYLEDERLRFVTEVAIVTQRPLLLRGEPGSGKSSFAPFVARNLNWRYYEQTVTGRTEAKDLLWRFDALQRLRDARRADSTADMSVSQYITPGPLWWAFNRPDALALASRVAQGESRSPEPFAELNGARDPLRAVVLIDEIDKADPNVPNDLLEVLGTNRFNVEEADHVVSRESVKPAGDKTSPNRYGSLLTVITTNEERDLPNAFLRRCVVHQIAEPEEAEKKRERLLNIALLHMKPMVEDRENGLEMVGEIAAKCLELREDAKRRQRRGPSIAEFLDAVRFCLVRGLTPNDDEWKVVQQSVLLK
jgi:MoxR-like ATPase